MDDQLRKFLTPREKRIEFAGKKLIARELSVAADVTGFADDDSRSFLLIVRCVFNEDGSPAFTVDDIPFLKTAPLMKIRDLQDAVSEVNGLKVVDEIKNSAAAPSAGKS